MRVVVNEKPRDPPKKKQEITTKDNFATWLKRIPFEFLQDEYRHNQIRRDIPVRPFIVDAAITPAKRDGMPAEKAQNSSPPMQPIVLRRSVYFLIFALLGIEVFFDLIYGGLRFLLMYAHLSQFFTSLTVDSFYFEILVILNLCKIVFMLVTALEWISFTYVITDKEIISRFGILNHKEKVYLCSNIQEVMFTQSMVGKLFNYGTIELHNPTFDEIVYLDSVPNPKKYADIIRGNLPTEKKRTYIPIRMP
ncbi:MAG TPA: PH domain-containing protein [Candidatus Eisenbacteria bacterium]|nr:PH domain-containing protein [Candidatus Eisenbacteria bacterium]